jgi:chorismate mutase
MSKTLDDIAATTGEVTGLVTQQLQGSKSSLDVALVMYKTLLQSKEETKLMTTEAVALEEAYRNQLEMVEQGGMLNREVLETLRQQILTLFQSRQITQDQARLYIQLHQQLEERLKLEDKIAELKEQQAPEEEIQAAELVLAAKLKEVAATKLEAEQQDKIKEAEKTRKETLEGTEKIVATVADETENTASSTSDAADDAGVFKSNIAESIQPLANASTQAGTLAANMERAAAAAAGMGAVSVPTGSGAGSYHGGPFYAAGGMFRGQDRQLTALAQGETVVNRKQSRKFFSELNAMNQGSQPVYRDQGGPVTNVGDVNVTVQGGDTSQQTVRGIGHALRRELKRGNITLR